MAYTIKDHLDYNLWANRLLAEKIQSVDEELLNRPLKSSFPSVAKTILHLWDSQVIWLSRLKGESTFIRPSESFKGTKYEMLAGLIASTEVIKSFIESKSPEFLLQKISYKNLRGGEENDQVTEILHHIVNHGTYHRGQIITLLREVGVTDLVNTDLIRFTRTH